MDEVEGGSEESLICELCKVHPTSYEDLQAHLRGHAHLVMVERSEVAKRSVYIRGFSNVPSAKDDLYGVMSQFGGVVSVAVVSSDSAVYALVEFATVDSALSALRHSPPLSLHGHTLTIKPRILKTDKIPKRAVLQHRKKRLDVAGGAGVMESVGEEGGKKEMAKKSKTQKRKERDEMVGGIRLNEQAAAALSAAHSIELQLETLASHCRLGNTTAEDQLTLAWQLQAKFHRLLPSCVVVPFGAPFSGHGTVSSDCDLSLLSDPSPLDLSLFIGPAYLPSHLHSVWDRLQTTRPMPAVEGESQQAGEVGMKEILAVLLADPSYSAVWALPSARVPIIQFMSGQLHCDLSLNNRLGPANTRLLGAYMNFDPRMAVLVPCVRLWVRGWGLGRRLLNNYAMSLMLIHCLQHTTPPVLPCLQEPGVWPRNMAWIGSRGLSVEKSISLGGWDCSFTDPRSLLPSSNTATPARLLLHIFKYFSEEFSFSEHMVAIHTTSPL
ncbi:Speckle targeted PIP5K1A-regulated poly(A) polymerase, partial [Geodia barretti]